MTLPSEPEDLGGGVWRVHTAKGEYLEVRNMPAFRATIGDGLAIGFGMLFIAVDRVTSFDYLQTVNARPVPAAGIWPAHDPGSIAAEKAGTALLMHMCGALHELNAAVEVLKCAGVTDALRKPTKDRLGLMGWRFVRTTAARWRESMGTLLRNQLAYHLGDVRVFIKGMSEWPTDKRMTISTSGGGTLDNLRFEFGFDLLCAGLDLSQEEYNKHARLAKADVDELRANAISMFVGVSRNRGVDLLKRKAWNLPERKP